MIRRDEVMQLGRTLKPHGLKGEISAVTDFDIDLSRLRCLIFDIEGILVPFFIEGYRKKNHESYLITLDDIDSEAKASDLSGKSIFMLKSDASELGLDDADDDLLYLDQLVGYKIYDTQYGYVGTIDYVDDSTENVIFGLTDDHRGETLIPFAEEFVVAIDEADRTLTLNLPSGLLELND